MLKLNLLSKNNKKEITLKRSYFLVKRISFILIVLAFFMSTIFFGANLIMEKNLKEYLTFSDLYKKSEQEFNDKKISDINQEINNALVVQKDFFPSSVIIKKMTEIVSDGIVLGNMRIDVDKKIVKIKGLANSRENFLIFKENLENSDFLKKIDSPLTSILQKQNIDFEISAELNLDKIIN